MFSVSSPQHHHSIDRSAKTLSCSALLVLLYPESLSQHQPSSQTSSMHEDHPQKKKRWGLLKRSNSNHNLSDESGSRTGSGSETSLHSSSRTESSTRSPGFLRQLWGKDTKKSSSAQSARQSLNSASPIPKSTVQDLSAHTDQEPSTPTVLAPHPNLGQDTSSSTTVASWRVE